MADQELRRLERDWLSTSDPDALKRLDAARRRLGLQEPPAQPDEHQLAWATLVRQLEHGPLVLDRRQLVPELRQLAEADPDHRVTDVGVTRALLGRVADARYDVQLAALQRRCEAARRAAMTRRQVQKVQPTSGPRPWRRLTEEQEQALIRLRAALAHQSGVLGSPLYELAEFMGLDRREAEKLLRAIRDQRLPDDRVLHAQVFEDEWVISYR